MHGLGRRVGSRMRSNGGCRESSLDQQPVDQRGAGRLEDDVDQGRLARAELRALSKARQSLDEPNAPQSGVWPEPNGGTMPPLMPG